MKPRYTVGTVTGWPINEQTMNATTRSINPRSKPPTIAYIYDSAYCYEPVWVFFRGVAGKNPEESAQAYADLLNAEEEELTR
jgi:hypothetical protein